MSKKIKSIGNIAQTLGVTLPKGIDENICYERVLTQHVYVKPGDIVISAGWYNRKQTVEEALNKGAVLVFCDKNTKKDFPQDNVIVLDDPLKSVIEYEKWCTNNCNAKRITITGSVGKTTTTGLINSVISNSFNTLTHHSASNSHGAVLRNAQRLTPEHEYWVQEIGGVQPDYVKSSAEFLCPDIVVLTNIGESHLNLYGTKESILEDKGSLEFFAKDDGVVIINMDDELLKNKEYSHKVITCSLLDDSADYYADNIKTELDGTYFDVHCNGGVYKVHLNLYGEYNAYNALFAIAVGQWAGVKIERSIELIGKYSPDGMRQNFINVGGYSLFVDAFNAEPRTVIGSAETLSKIPAKGKGRKIFVTGHIDKLGPDSAKMHKEVGQELAKLNLDQIVLFAEDSKYTYDALINEGAKNVILMGSREELDNWLSNNITRDDIVFFKSGQFVAALAKSVDHVFGTKFQNEQQFNEGRVVEYKDFKIRIRQDNIAEIVEYVGKNIDVVIPEKYEDNTIIRISPFAFKKQYELRSVSIPDSVVNIGREAFYICPKLKSVKLPRNLKIIESNAFNYCKSLEHVEIPPGTIHIDRRAFYDCLSLKSITLPSSIGYLGENVLDTDKVIKERDLIVNCESASYVEEYFKSHDLEVETIDLKDDIKLKGKIMPSKNTKDLYLYDLVKKEMEVEPSELTAEELSQFKEVWGEYYKAGIAHPEWAALYKAKTGVFDPEYIGHDLHFKYVDAKFCDKTYIRGLCDKNMMPLVLPTGKHPITILRKLSGTYLDREFNKVSESEAVNILMENRRNGAVIKQCRSSAGVGVTFVSEDTSSEEILNALKKSNYVTVQKVVKQHPEMEKMNASSVNTVRVMTIMLNGESHVLSSCVRIGKPGGRVDNTTGGGVSCGINPDGSLKDYGCRKNGDRIKQHPSGFVFADGKVPFYERVCNEAKKLHYCIPMFGIVSWDICIDELGDPVVIEYNVGGSVSLLQQSNGPLYGKYREEILKLVFPNIKNEVQSEPFTYDVTAEGTIITKGSNWREIIIPEKIENKSIHSISERAFFDNRNLRSIKIQGNVDKIEYLAFCKCHSLESISIEGVVKKVDRYAFNECRSLREIKFNSGLESIGQLAFAGCTNLEKIYLPDSVKDIADDFLKYSSKATIICSKGSCVENYAISKNLKYTIE